MIEEWEKILSEARDPSVTTIARYMASHYELPYKKLPDNLKTMSKTKIKCGYYVEDVVTGFKGYVISKTKWLTGCNTYQVQPSCPDDDCVKRPDSEMIDEDRLRIIDGVSPIVINVKVKGGEKSRIVKESHKLKSGNVRETKEDN